MFTLTQKVLSQGNSVANALSTYKGLAVMLIDMQSSYVSGKYGVLFSEDEQMLYTSHSKVIRELCVENYVPLINVVFAGDGPLCKASLDMLAEVPILKPHPKSSESAFEKNSRLPHTLEKMGIDTIFVMGIYASACVYRTAIGAKNKKFSVFTADDVIADSVRLSVKKEHRTREDFIDSGIMYYNSHEDFLHYVKTCEKFSKN